MIIETHIIDKNNNQNSIQKCSKECNFEENFDHIIIENNEKLESNHNELYSHVYCSTLFIFQSFIFNFLNNNATLPNLISKLDIIKLHRISILIHRDCLFKNTQQEFKAYVVSKNLELYFMKKNCPSINDEFIYFYSEHILNVINKIKFTQEFNLKQLHEIFQKFTKDDSKKYTFIEKAFQFLSKKFISNDQKISSIIVFENSNDEQNCSKFLKKNSNKTNDFETIEITTYDENKIDLNEIVTQLNAKNDSIYNKIFQKNYPNNDDLILTENIVKIVKKMPENIKNVVKTFPVV